MHSQFYIFNFNLDINLLFIFGFIFIWDFYYQYVENKKLLSITALGWSKDILVYQQIFQQLKLLISKRKM